MTAVSRKAMRSPGWLLLLPACLFCLFWQAPLAAIETSNIEGQQPLGREAWVLDLSSSATQEWLAAPGPWLAARVAALPADASPAALPTDGADGSAWQRNETDKLLLDAPGRLNWVILDLHYTGLQPHAAVLELTGIDGVAWQYRDHAGRLVQHADDFDKARGGRPYQDASPLLSLQLEPGQRLRLHLAAYTITKTKFASFTLWDADTFRAQRFRQQLFDGVYFGLVCAVLLYSLFLAVAMRQYTYLCFALFIAASAGVIYVGSGISMVFGLQNSLRSALGLAYFCQGLVGVFGGLFSIALLNIRHTNHKLYLLWLAVAGLNVAATAWVMLLARNGGFAAADISSTFIIVALVWLCNQMMNFATLWHYRHHSRLVLYWFFAVTLHTWALAFWPLLLNSALAIPFAPYHFAQLATLVDTLLMASLVAHHLRNEHDSRLKAQQSAVENLRLAHDIERAKSNFVATVGHDLRSPVQAISHFTQTLKQQGDASQRAKLDKIDENIVMISDLLDGMVKLSQTEWQGLKPRQSPVALGRLLQQLHSEFAAQAERRGLQFVVDDSSCHVSSDRVCLSQILRNLIDNALKFTEKGSVHLMVAESDESVILRLEDTGCGIPESALPHIFDEFFQVPGSAQLAGGVGLGLSIVARLSRLLDIELHVDSKPGSGTTFELIVPKAGPVIHHVVAPAPAAPLTEEWLPGSLQGLHVLLLSSVTPAPDSLAGMLQRWGAKLYQLDSPLALLVHFREQLLLCDLILADSATFTHLLEHLGKDDTELLLQCPAPVFVEYPDGQDPARTGTTHPHTAVNSSMKPMQFRSLVQRSLKRAPAMAE